MTDVNKSQTDLIDSPDAALRLYQPLPPGFGGKIGLEVEMNLYRAVDGQVVIPGAAAMLRMQEKLKSMGHDAQLEAAGVLEYASPAVDVADVGMLVQAVTEDVATFESAAADEGYTRSPFSVLPTVTMQDAMDNLVPRERLKTALSAIPSIYGVDALKIPLLTTGVQASFSPENADEMFRMAKRAYMLTPLLLAAMNSNAGFTENDPAGCSVHARASYYAAHRRAGGLAESFNKAVDGASFVRAHVEMVFDIPMFFAYDLDGNILPSGKDHVHTFRQLIGMGLNTQSNFELAESFLYNDVKICNLRDGSGNVLGKRLEVRAADSGLHQPDDVLLLTAALVPDGATAVAFEAVLKNYGFTGHPPLDADLLAASRHAAVNHGGHFMNVSFGTGSLRDFAADVAGLIAAHYTGKPELSATVSRLCDMLLTGNCDAQVNARQYKTLPDVVAKLTGGATGAKPAKALKLG